MRITNLLESIVDKQVERERLTEITQLVKEYDSLDNTLIENKSYDRDIQIVVRLDELGVFDDIINEIGVRGGPRGAGKDVSKATKQAGRLGSKVGSGEKPDMSQIQGVVNTPGAISRLFTAGKAGVSRLASMLSSALKSGKTKLVSKIKAAINKVRGKKPDAPVSDVPGVPQDVAAQVDDIPTPELGTEPTAEKPETPAPVVEPTLAEPEIPAPEGEPSTDTPTEPEVPTPEEPAEPETPTLDEPKDKDVVSPETRDRLQTLAGIEPEKPAAEPDISALEKPTEEPPAPVISPEPEVPAVQPKPTSKKSKSTKVIEPPTPETPVVSTPAPEKPAVPTPVSTPTPTSTEPAMAEPPTADEPKRLIPKVEPAPVPDEPKRLIPKGQSPTAKPTEPEKKPEEPEKPVQPWSAQGRELRAQQRAAMSPEERAREKERSMRRMGFRPEPRGVGDRLKSAWKAFTAKPGDTVDIKQGYRSVFAEIKRLMEQLNVIETVLQKHAVYEELVGGQKNLDVNKNGKIDANDLAMLRARRDEIRKALTEQIIREELYKHNTRLAELNPQQRTALAETVKKRSNKMWEQLAEMRMGHNNVNV